MSLVVHGHLFGEIQLQLRTTAFLKFYFYVGLSQISWSLKVYDAFTLYTEIR